MPRIVDRLRARRESVKDSLNGVVKSTEPNTASSESGKPAGKRNSAAVAPPRAVATVLKTVQAAPVDKNKRKLKKAKPAVANKRVSSMPRKQPKIEIAKGKRVSSKAI